LFAEQGVGPLGVVAGEWWIGILAVVDEVIIV
jgi:hypothetical protein